MRRLHADGHDRCSAVRPGEGPSTEPMRPLGLGGQKIGFMPPKATINRYVARFGRVEDLVAVIGRASPGLADVGLIGHQPHPPPRNLGRDTSLVDGSY